MSNTTEDLRERDRSGCSFKLDGHPEVVGINICGIARGAISISNVHLANAFLHLACKEGGGFGDEDRCIDPDVRVRGMKPASFVSNTLVAASVLSAIMMPVIGAIIDFTPHRKWVGIATAAALAIISGVQIGTVEETWFAMCILQAIIFMIYQLQIMTLFAYFPEIARAYGEQKMISYASTWSAIQFLAQAIANMIVIILNIKLQLGTVQTAMACQGLTLAFCIFFLTPGWYMIPRRPRLHKLKKGRSLVLAGFEQNYRTFKRVWKDYRGFFWFLICVMWGESAALAVGSTAVIFLSLGIGLNALQIAIFFEISLVGVVFGCKAGAVITRMINPTRSLQLAQLGCALATIIGCWLVEDVEPKELTYMWGCSIGFFLGWFYPMENVFFSMVVPANQEAEFSGIFNYSSQIMGWLPPLVFTVMVENDIAMAWALTITASFFFLGIFFLRVAGGWDELVEAGQKVILYDDSMYDDESESEGNKIGDKDKEKGVENDIDTTVNIDNSSQAISNYNIDSC